MKIATALLLLLSHVLACPKDLCGKINTARCLAAKGWGVPQECCQRASTGCLKLPDCAAEESVAKWMYTEAKQCARKLSGSRAFRPAVKSTLATKSQRRALTAPPRLRPGQTLTIHFPKDGVPQIPGLARSVITWQDGEPYAAFYHQFSKQLTQLRLASANAIPSTYGSVMTYYSALILSTPYDMEEPHQATLNLGNAQICTLAEDVKGTAGCQYKGANFQLLREGDAIHYKRHGQSTSTEIAHFPFSSLHKSQGPEQYVLTPLPAMEQLYHDISPDKLLLMAVNFAMAPRASFFMGVV